MAEGVWTPQVVPDGYTGFKSYCGNANVFSCIDNAGYAAGDVAVLSSGAVYRWDGSTWNLVAAGGSGSPEVFPLADGATPAATPAGGVGFAIDPSGRIWVYISGAWGKRFDVE